MTRPAPPSSYDEVPYPSIPFVQTHPNRLATIATVLGMRPAPAPVASCRVLELGCGRGENLIPLALELPGAELHGIDLSARQVDEGRAMAAELGATNLRLEHRDILDFPHDAGRFDYIIAHGVYSWVPAPVRDRLMQICARHLRPHGVAYVSYNTFPGWHMNRVVRDLLLFRTRDVADARARIEEAARTVDLMSRAVPDGLAHYRAAFRQVHAQLKNEHMVPSWLFHEFLEETNEPVHFREFVSHAGAHGLKFLAEAKLWEMQPEHLSEAAVRALAQLGDDLIRREQYLDYIGNRMFRQTLLCQEGASLDRDVSPERIAALHVAADLECPEPDLSGHARFPFRHRERGVEGATDHPLTQAALLTLAETWPRTHSFRELCARAHARLPGHAPGSAPAPADVAELGENLAPLYPAGLIELHVHPPRFAHAAGERPLGSPWARHQLRGGGPLTNLRHHGVRLGLLERRLLALLDGTRTRPELVDALCAALDDGAEVLLEDGAVASGPARRQVLEASLDSALAELARRALLVA